jgi:hypothetical protein
MYEVGREPIAVDHEWSNLLAAVGDCLPVHRWVAQEQAQLALVPASPPNPNAQLLGSGIWKLVGIWDSGSGICLHVVYHA